MPLDWEQTSWVPHSSWNIGGWDRKLRNRRFEQLKQVLPSDMTGKLSEEIDLGWDGSCPFFFSFQAKKLFKLNFVHVGGHSDLIALIWKKKMIWKAWLFTSIYFSRDVQRSEKFLLTSFGFLGFPFLLLSIQLCLI